MQTTAKPPLPPALVLIVGVFAISISAILIRFAQGDAPSLIIAMWRLTLASCVLVPLSLARRRDEFKTLSMRELPLAALSGIMLALHFATWISSLAFTTVASSGVLVATSPLWVGLAAPFVLGEHLTRQLKIGIGLALAGSIVVGVSDLGSGGGSQPLWGNFLALVGALSAAAYLLIGRRLRVKLSLLTYTTLVYGMAALTLIVVAVIGGYELFDYAPQTYLLFALMALFPQLLGHTSFNYALGYLPASYISVTIISEPVGAGVLALILLGEVPPLFTIVGGVFILAGIFVASTRST
jgi:drug/metabolite transporter (DMT)-like permease